MFKIASSVLDTLPSDTPAAKIARLEELRSVITDAIQTDAPPSPALIKANSELCDLEAALKIPRPVSFPTEALLPMTDVCNARCRFCPYSEEIVNRWNVDLDMIERMDWIKFLQQVAFGLGLGEPFAAKGLLDILNHWRATAPFTRVWATTNGSLISSRYVEAIVGYVGHLFISLNAARRETYERTMPPLKWDTTLRNLRAIRDAKLKAGTNLPEIELSYVISLENAEEAPTLPLLAAELGAPRIVWYHAVPHTSPYIDYLFPATHHLSFHPELYNRVLAETRAECERLNITLRAPAPFTDANRVVDYSNDGVKAPANMCNMPWHYLLATNNTHLTQVCCGYGSPQLPAFTWPTARRFHEDLWNTPALVHMRATINTAQELPICTLCRATDKNSPQVRAQQTTAMQDSNEMLLQVLKRAEKH